MRITILGSSGQIGAYLTEYLRNKGHHVTEFDKNNSYHEDMTKIPNPFLRNAIMESDFVFFLAFDVDVNILDRIETDIIDKIKQVPIQRLFHR